MCCLSNVTVGVVFGANLVRCTVGLSRFPAQYFENYQNRATCGLGWSTWCLEKLVEEWRVSHTHSEHLHTHGTYIPKHSHHDSLSLIHTHTHANSHPLMHTFMPYFLSTQTHTHPSSILSHTHSCTLTASLTLLQTKDILGQYWWRHLGSESGPRSSMLYPHFLLWAEPQPNQSPVSNHHADIISM